MDRRIDISRRAGFLLLPLWALFALAAAGAPPAGTQVAKPVRALSLGTASDGVLVAVGEPVQFLDSSLGNVTSWSWDFSFDPAAPAVDSTAQNPVWTYTQVGLWSVHLEVCNSGGCSTATKQIEVVEPCTFPTDLALSAQTVDTTQSFDACYTITAGTGFAVVQPGAVTFRAGRTIALGNGFSVGGGASFQAVIDPTLAVP
jgi:hypothetical protein